MKSFVAVIAAVALGAGPLSGCGSDDPAPASSPDDRPSTSATTASVSVVVIGDSIAYNASQDCPECTSFADSYGAALGEELDTTVEVANRSRHDGARTSDILDELVGGGLTEPLASADVVIVSVGYNDQPPYLPDMPCYGVDAATAEEAIDAVAATTTACVDEVTATVRQAAADALAEVRAEAPEAAIAALVPYDSWNGWPILDERPAKQRQAATRVVKYALETWREALCAEVAEIDGVCIDVYREFNGPDGSRPAGELLAEDYTHPSQQGNDLIRDVLLEARLLG